MQKINVAIVGYGNIGKYALEAIQSANDMELVGIVRRDILDIPQELSNISVVTDIKELGKIDVAILCTPSRLVMENAKKYLSMGINTVDSFDIHSAIFELRTELDKVCRDNSAVSIISAGWDPGSDSVVRALLEACAPKGITYTNFGPGMSMGHSVVAKSKKGVTDALSITIPTGTGIHRRMVYVSLEESADFEKISEEIKKDSYFEHDETIVIKVDDVNDFKDKGHAVNLTRKGVSGATDNQLFQFEMKINNPALTSQIMISCARASMKQKPGAYTMIEIPPVNFLEGDIESAIKRLV